MLGSPIVDRLWIFGFAIIIAATDKVEKLVEDFDPGDSCIQESGEVIKGC